MATILVDTNILFSALVNKNSKISSFLLEPHHALVMPKFGFVELFNLKTSVEWGLKCIDFYFWQGTMRRNNALLQRIVTQQKLKSGVL